ncbi:MAG: GFA family protein [Xanthomonadales bacterium]|nr:GFA family protein [Xanthomonadales bacterium]
MTPAYGGRCQCGELKYEVVEPPLTCYACHCRDCQSASGSAFSLSMIVPATALRVNSGELQTLDFSYHAGERTRHACAQCGTTLWVTSPAQPELAALKAGTLDDKALCEPVAHVWYQSRQRWIQANRDAEVFERQPDDMAVLVDLWQRREA